MDPTETSGTEVFDLGPAAPARSLAAEEDVFGLGMLPETLPAAPAPPVRRERGEGNGGAEPFPDPAPEESRRLYLAGFRTGRIFHFEDLAAPVEEAAAPGPVVAAEEPAAAVSVPARAAGEPAAAVHVPELLPLAAPAAAAATVTLAELYLRQGHFDEAKRLFAEVLEREPGNSAAREGLSRVAVPAPAAAAPAPVASAEIPLTPAAEAPAAPVHAVPEPAAPAPAFLEPVSPAPAASTEAPPPPVVEASGPELAAPALAPPSPAAPASAAPAPASEAAHAAPREPEPFRFTGDSPSEAFRLTAADLCVGLEDPHASRKVRRAHLLQSYLARLRQPRRPHVP